MIAGMKDEGISKKMEYIGAYKPEDAKKILRHFSKENIAFSIRDDISVHTGNSPFTESPGGSTDDEIEKIFVHNRDMKRAVAICEELFGKRI
jgi:hypothetical protein